jgi:hypothetical protein
MIAEYEASLGASKSATARVAADRTKNGGAARERPTVSRAVADRGAQRTPKTYDEVFDKDKDDIPF